MRGVVARRRVAFFGQSYDRGAAGPLPAFLLPLRATIAQWASVHAEAFAMALINEYRPGSPIGWHRDAPQYDIVAGISLLSACRMKFRPYRSPSSPAPKSSRRRSTTHEIALARRSAYLMTHEARTAHEHHIPPVVESRYSVTFRTLR
jgi:alkylated DNA repair dioxygenase AlkB